MGLFSSIRRFITVERDRSGNWSYWFKRDAFGEAKDYLTWSIENPVLSTICSIRSELYSQMKINHYNNSGEVIENSPYVSRLNNPNYFQSKSDFFFQQMWYLSAIGTNYIFHPKTTIQTSQVSPMYNLVPSEVDIKEVGKIKDFILTSKDEKEFETRTIEYKMGGVTKKIPFSKIIPLYDAPNGLIADEMISAVSRVKGLEKVLQNIDKNLEAKNVNLKMSAHYLLSNDSNDNARIIKDEDKKDILSKLSKNNVHITDAKLNVSHMVSDLKKLFLDESFAADATKCLLAYGMNQDILRYWTTGSTYENQEQGIIRFIQSSIQASADNTMNSFSSAFGLLEKGEELKASFNHLPVMQIVMRTKIETLEKVVATATAGVESGMIKQNEGKELVNKIMKELMSWS